MKRQDELPRLLENELAMWAIAGLKPRLFWRDDDAVEDTPALRRMIAMAEANDAPLLLASIPALAKPSLGALLRAAPLLTAAVHGYAHVSHAPVGEKPCEIGSDRPLEVVLAELADGRRRLGELADGRLSALLVPPWNRIDDSVLPHVVKAGFGGVSAHGWTTRPAATPMVNAHVDIIHWSGGKVGRDAGWAFRELATNLAEARRRGGVAIGVLTHHLDHDEQAWSTMAAIFDVLGPYRADWVAADALLPDQEA